jgi:hypothetical protein
MLGELRNQLVHRTFLNKVISVHDFAPKSLKVRFLDVLREFKEGNQSDHLMDMEVIQYLEKSLQKVRELIFSIRASDPLLQEQH